MPTTMMTTDMQGTAMGTIINMSEPAHSPLALLGMLHISSAALPVGAFAYSQGLEYALDSGWCKTGEQVEAWIRDNLQLGLGQLDLPIYVRMFNAWQNQNEAELKKWNQQLLAFRESKELYLEDTQVGNAFAQWHLGQDAQRQSYLNCIAQPTVVSMHALAGVLNSLDVQTALLGFCWSWAENQIACASKAMPMGQTMGQQILQRLLPIIAQVCEQAVHINDDDIGSGLMGLAMASALHEQQYSRLFRS